MRDTELSALLGVFNSAVALLAHLHRVVLDVHAVNMDCLRDGVDRRGEQTRPRREKMSEGGIGFEVCSESETCEGDENAL